MIPPQVMQGLEAARALLDRAGPVGWILAVLSVVALAVALARIWRLTRSDLSPRAPEQALRALRSGGRVLGAHPAAQALAAVAEGRRRGAPEQAVREEAARVAEAALDPLRDWLRPLEVIGALAPLLGLFGTVLGMIDAFAALEAAGSSVDPAILSGGIWTALLTTALGLGVAMPAVAALAWCERRVERVERATDDALAAAFTFDAASPGGTEAYREAVHVGPATA